MSFPNTFVKDFHDEASVKQMEYQSLGGTGLVVSKVSIGGGTFSHFYGEVNEKHAIDTIHLALRRGINYIDTAPWYGQGKSESIYGKALKTVPRQAYYIGTKVGRYELDFKNMFNFTAEKTYASVERSLQLLDLDYVDIIQIHDIEFAENLNIIINETLPALEKIVKDGKAKHIGITGYPLEVLKEAILAAPGRFEVVLSYSRNNLIDNSLEDYLEFFKEQNVGVICASGHAMGLLTNAGPQEWNPADDSIKKISHEAGHLCRQADIELGKLAMYHFLQLAGPATFLVGMQSIKLVELNLNAYINGLDEPETKMLAYLKTKVFNRIKQKHWEGIEVERYWSNMKN